MKKMIFLTAACLLLVSSPAFAAIQTFSATDKGSDTRTKLNENFTELDTGKASKTAVVRYWSDWPTTAPNNVLAVNTIVAYNGGLYKVTQELTKTGSTADPETLTAYFSEVGAGDDLGSATAADVAALFTTGSGDCLGANGQLVACSGGSGTDDQTASEVAFTPNGSIAATNVQAAIQEVRDEAGSGHTEVTLGTDADAIFGLSTQQITLDSQTANYVFAAPNGSAGDPIFRALVAGDIPTLSRSKISDLGTSAQYNVGTGANNIVQLNSSGELPFDIPGKANASCFASESAFNACFDLTWASGGISHATSDGNYYASRNGAWASLASVYQPLDADLTAIANLSCTENQIPKKNGSGVWACASDATAAGAGYVSTPPTYSDEACTNGQYALDASYRYDCLSNTWSRTTRTSWSNPTPSDTTPDAFTFGDTQTDAALSTQYCSAAVTPTGYDAAATVAATGTATSLGWKVNGGSFVTSGTLSPGQTISACGTSSSSNSTSTTASVTVGGVAATSPFTMTTVAGGGTGTALRNTGSGQGTITDTTDSPYDLTQNFTVEAWIYKSGNYSSVWGYVARKDTSFSLRIPDGGAIQCQSPDQGVAATDSTAFNSLTDGWHHVACVWSSTAGLSLYRDGNRIYNVDWATTAIAVNNNNIEFMGHTGTMWPFRTDEIRISNTVRYTGTTYTVPTTPFTSDANTVGLFHLDESSGTTLEDSSSNGLDITLTGTWSFGEAGAF